MHRKRSNIHERFLRHIWSKQYIKGASLLTIDNIPLKVLKAGILNPDGGPDFTDAEIIIGGTRYRGDVEIHRTPLEWLQHQHQHDPRYNKVILHVVLEGDPQSAQTFAESGRRIPVLVLDRVLSQPIRVLWQKAILDERARTSEVIPCSRLNADIPSELLHDWLRKLSVERLELKLRRFEERLRQLAEEEIMAFREPHRRYGEIPREGYPEEIPPPTIELKQHHFSKKRLWEQVLYEGVMDALGFSKNREPFVRLAQSVTLQRVEELRVSSNTHQLEALLFGAAGLLPSPKGVQLKESRAYLRSLRSEWQDIKRLFKSDLLKAADWQFFPTRPLNFPTVRLAAAVGLIQKILHEDLFRKIIQSFKSLLSPPETHESLLRLFHAELPPFWQSHYTFDQTSPTPVRALGRSRINDIIVNTILPIVLLYARIFKEREIRERVLGFYEWFPPLSENSVTKLMENQLNRGKVKISSVSLQQGIIQLYKYYCVEKRCAECEVGRVVFQQPLTRGELDKAKGVTPKAPRLSNPP
ncbi:MAG TPA: DUF2851 family protein [Bacteroidota bacterium]|nr:DUF2851 family protein [Bacteroidota bacterium]